MTDLTYSYLYMSNRDLLILETYNSHARYVSGELSDEELEVPAHMIPPNPDDSDVLPSQVHPSYPYGNPTSIKHPAARPRVPQDPNSRALFEDMGFGGGGINGSIGWRDLALDLLLPVNREKEEAERAAQARKMGASSNNHPQQANAPNQVNGAEQTIEEESEEGDEGDDVEEGDEGEFTSSPSPTSESEESSDIEPSF